MDDDRNLVARSKRGDIDAFEELVVRHQKKMLNIAYRMTGSYDDACDVVQDAFVSAYKGIGQFEERAVFRTWICSIVINLSKNRLRQVKASMQRHELPIHAEEGFVFVDPPSNEPSALEILEKRDIQRSVQECIRRLEEDFRLVVVLRDIQGFAYSEIGDILKLADGTVKSRLSRGRELLRNCLRKALGTI